MKATLKHSCLTLTILIILTSIKRFSSVLRPFLKPHCISPNMPLSSTYPFIPSLNTIINNLHTTLCHWSKKFQLFLASSLPCAPVLLCSPSTPLVCILHSTHHSTSPSIWPLQRGHSDDACVLALTLCTYTLRKGDLVVLSWPRVRRMRRGSISSELLMCGGGVRSILLFPLVARCLETIDVCILACC